MKMEKSFRTFIAIKIIPKNTLIQLFSRLKVHLNDEDIKWVEPNNFHLTLRFLGNTSATQVEEIKTGLENIACNYKCFSFNLKGLGFFKNNGKPKVLFAKTEETQTLKLLTTEIENLIVRFGFEKETRDFNPHLTLGRIRFLNEKHKFFLLVQKFAETEIQKVNVSELIFYQSILNSTNPIYSPIKIIKLN
jgi:2'-5' RNA ligase